VPARAPSDTFVIGLLASVASVAAFLYYFHTGQLLLYGDAVAHLNIARRVVDSLTPGPLQLGTVWLPLPHIVTLPFVWIDSLWQSGIAGSIASMAAYVAGVVGMLELGRAAVSPAAGRIAALVYAANPNLLYMQSTAMTESVFLAAVIWSVYFLARYAQATQANDEVLAPRHLYKAGIALLCAIFTRYDGWFLAGAATCVVIFVWVLAHREQRRYLRAAVRNFVIIVAMGPAIWMAYNYAIFGNALEFATGPHSARGIAARTTPKDSPPHPGADSTKTAAIYFVKTAKLNVGEGKREWWLFGIAVVGSLLAALHRDARVALLLWVPLPFYALSIAYGSVPIFIPEWWPFSYYNVRYGLQLLPAIALFTGVAYAMVRRAVQNRAAARAALVLVMGAVATSYADVCRHTPICLREARVNAVTRVAFESALAAELRKLPADARLLMYTGSYVGALQSAGIPLKRTVNEGNYRIWQAALAAPSSSADYVIAVEGDAVAGAVAARPEGLTPIARIQMPEKPPAVIYRAAR